MADQWNNQCRSRSPTKIGKKLARAAVELYTAHYGALEWNLVDMGMIYLMKCHGNYFINLYSKSKAHFVWQCEINRTVYYKINTPYFHVIIVNETLYGIYFSDLTEAEIFYNAVDRIWRFQNLSDMLTNLTSKFTNLFAKKQVPPPPIYNRSQSHSKCIAPKPLSPVLIKPVNAPRKVHVPPPIKPCKYIPPLCSKYSVGYTPRKRPDTRKVHYEDSEDYAYPEKKINNYNMSVNQPCHGYIPQPPPLPPPPQFYHGPIKRRPNDSICYDESQPDFSEMSDCGPNPIPSFKYQIKQEAKRRHPSRQNMFKYLP